MVTWYTACKTNAGSYTSYVVFYTFSIWENYLESNVQKEKSLHEANSFSPMTTIQVMASLLCWEEIRTLDKLEYEVRVANDRQASKLSFHLQHLDFTAEVSGAKIKVEYLKGQRTKAWFYPSS